MIRAPIIFLSLPCLSTLFIFCHKYLVENKGFVEGDTFLLHRNFFFKVLIGSRPLAPGVKSSHIHLLYVATKYKPVSLIILPCSSILHS